MTNTSETTPAFAVVVGHLVVTLPVITIIALVTIVVYFSIGPPAAHEPDLMHFLLHTCRFDVGILVGAIVGWLWWSAAIPRWREWVNQKGADEERTQLLAQRTLLVWPKGSFFEKTEFRRRSRAQTN